MTASTNDSFCVYLSGIACQNVLVQVKIRTELESVSNGFICMMHQHFSVEICVDVERAYYREIPVQLHN